jgi:hypothetical protein
MNFRISHIFREGNCCADKLANFSLNSRKDHWWETVPSFIVEDLFRNRTILQFFSFQ